MVENHVGLVYKHAHGIYGLVHALVLKDPNRLLWLGGNSSTSMVGTWGNISIVPVSYQFQYQATSSVNGIHHQDITLLQLIGQVTWKLFANKNSETTAFLLKLGNLLHTFMLLFACIISCFAFILSFLTSDLKLLVENMHVKLEAWIFLLHCFKPYLQQPTHVNLKAFFLPPCWRLLEALVVGKTCKVAYWSIHTFIFFRLRKQTMHASHLTD